MADASHTRAWLELALVPGVSISAKLDWLREFGSPEAVLERSVSDLRRISEEAQPLKDRVEAATIDGVLDWAAESGGRCLFLGDEDYPKKVFDRLADAPLAVYARGDMSLLDRTVVAMTGTPRPTASGSGRARTFAHELAGEGIAVAAGLSPGIGGAALKGAMAAGRTAVGVVGTPASWEGMRLTEDVAAAGLLVSEHAPRTGKGEGGYSRRHRLLPAIADLLLVVEAPSSCDTLLLAGDAGDMGCEVAAVPADPSNDTGRGCNNLIREGAALVETSVEAAAVASAAG